MSPIAKFPSRYSCTVRFLLAAALSSVSCCADPPALPAIVFSGNQTAEAEITAQARSNYRSALEKLERQRIELGQRYRSAAASDDGATGQATIAAARSLILTALIEDIFPAWYGTPWDFNGVSQTPGEGRIACGYFVTTTLRDAGFVVPRIKLAQQPSQTIINSLTGRESISISAGKPIADIIADLRQSGSGLYIVGLDTHVGFVIHDGKHLGFVHASYYGPYRAVVAEACDSKNPLADSNYRVVGRILDDNMLVRWLTTEAFPVRSRG